MIVNGVDLHALAQVVADKRVCVVGPAATMIGSGLGGFIDAHDLIVRINDGYPVPDALQADCGRRMNILSHACCEHLDAAKYLPYLTDLKALIITAHPRPRMMRATRRAKYDALVGNASCPVISIHRAQKMALGQAVGVPYKLNGGMLLVVALLACPLAKLFVCGFTCHMTGYLDGYGNDWSGAPNMHYLDLFRRLIRDDGRLCVDDVLAGIIKGHP